MNPYLSPQNIVIHLALSQIVPVDQHYIGALISINNEKIVILHITRFTSFQLIFSNFPQGAVYKLLHILFGRCMSGIQSVSLWSDFIRCPIIKKVKLEENN